jgi:hypothetical protein
MSPETWENKRYIDKKWRYEDFNAYRDNKISSSGKKRLAELRAAMDIRMANLPDKILFTARMVRGNKAYEEVAIPAYVQQSIKDAYRKIGEVGKDHALTMPKIGVLDEKAMFQSVNEMACHLLDSHTNPNCKEIKEVTTPDSGIKLNELAGLIGIDMKPRARGLLDGVGKDAPMVINELGGKQSKTNGRYDLLPPMAVVAVAGVLDEGAVKYGENNWHKIHSSSHFNHMAMHYFAHLTGDMSDDHMEHAACRALMGLEMLIKEREEGMYEETPGNLRITVPYRSPDDYEDPIHDDDDPFCTCGCNN